MDTKHLLTLLDQQPKLRKPPKPYNGLITKPFGSSATWRWVRWRDYCRDVVTNHPDYHHEWHMAWLEQAEAVVEWRATLPDEDRAFFGGTEPPKG